MKKWIALCLFLAVAGGLTAAPPWPVVPSRPKPEDKTPPPDPTSPLKMASGTLYVVNQKSESVIRTHPAGVLKFTPVKGPAFIHGKFADGNGQNESRTYDGPFVYVGEAVGKGRVELDIIPLGLKTEKDILTDTVDVDVTIPGPQPPGPNPPGPNPPTPVVPAPIPEAGFRVLIVYERDPAAWDALPAAQKSIIDGQKFRDFVDANCVKANGFPEYRFYDKDIVVNDPLWKAAMARDRKSIPWIVISNGTTGYEGPLPDDTEKAIALASKYLPKTGGGK